MRVAPLFLLASLLSPLPAEDPPPEKRQVTEQEAFARADQLVANVVEALDPSSMDIVGPRTLDVEHEEGFWVNSVQLRALAEPSGGVRSHWVAAVCVVHGGSVTWMTPLRGSLRFYERQGGEVKLVSTAGKSSLARAAGPTPPDRLPLVPMDQYVGFRSSEPWNEPSGAWELDAEYESIAGG